MFHLLDKIRQKPESQRRFYALLITFLLTAVIVVVWVSILITQGVNQTGKGADQRSVDESRKESQEDGSSPFKSLKETGGRIYGDMKELIKEAQQEPESADSQ